MDTSAYKAPETRKVIAIAYDGTLNSIGYHESDDKLEFRKGVKIALNKAGELFDKEVDRLKALIQIYQNDKNRHEENLKTIASILRSYD